MNKIARFILILSVVILPVWTVNAGNLGVILTSQVENNCTGADLKFHYYLPHDTNTMKLYPADTMRAAKLTLVTTNSIVSLHQNNNILGTSCRDWSRAGKVVPGDTQSYFVVGNSDGCEISKKPIPAGIPAFQLVYKIKYKEETGKKAGVQGSYQYMPYLYNGVLNNGYRTFDLPDQTARTWTEEKLHANECASYYVSYCGDGKIDSGTFINGTFSETCDPADSNKTNWGNGGCDPVTCQPRGDNICLPAKTGAQSSPVRETDTLCTVGTVSNFKSERTGNTTNYSWTCNNAPKSSDCTARYTTSSGGGGGGNVYYVPECVSPTVNVCKNSYYSSHADCVARYGDRCYSTFQKCSDNIWNADRNVPACRSGGGGGGGSHNPYCGNGILEPGEECDDGRNGSPRCTANCTLILANTNPGANPLTDVWMKIPTLSQTNIGKDFMDANGRMRFIDNRVVLGVGSRVFTYADTVGFGIARKYTAPLQIQADKEFCISSAHTSVITGNPVCKSLGTNTTLPRWTRSDGTKYIVLGMGNFLAQADANIGRGISCKPLTAQYKLCEVRSTQEVDKFFKGKELLGFIGAKPGIANLSFGTRNVPDIVQFGARVTKEVVGGAASTSRGIEKYTNLTPLGSYLRENSNTGFIININPYTTVHHTNAHRLPNGYIVPKPVFSQVAAGDVVVSKPSDLKQFINRGNNNVYTVKGNIVVHGCPNSTFEMEGVKTVIAEGNITFRCEIAYKQKDTTSSWAWIAKGGNIVVYNGNPVNGPADNGITNLAGVYLAISENGKGGSFVAENGYATNAILKIDGTLYGNADPLFTSRTYARGTNAYEILTTGTVLMYSNRALMNPPPMLASYLNTYHLQRVVKQ